MTAVSACSSPTTNSIYKVSHPLLVRVGGVGPWTDVHHPLPQGAGGDSLVAKLCLTLVTSWTVACQAPLSVGLSRQEYWSGLPFLSPGDLPNPGIEVESPALQADSLLTELHWHLK